MGVFFDPKNGHIGWASSSGGASTGIPQYTSDPASPSAEDAWVLDTVAGGGGGTSGEIYAYAGLGFPLISAGGATTHSYQFSYYTNEGTIVRTTLS